LIEIDDDNEPVPKNIPVIDENISNEGQYSSNWGHGGICYRRQVGSVNRKAKLKHHTNQHLKLTKLQLFEVLFPIFWVKEVLIPETNKILEVELKYGEFLQFLGIWLHICTTVGHEQWDFWSKIKVEGRDTPFKFNDIMSKYRFESILNALKYTKHEPSALKDFFWEVQKMIDAWNRNMEDEFSASWISCLDESMSKWLNQWTCPGFMVVPRKPWQCGNEYHTICCSSSGVLFALEIVEGKDAPPEAEQKEYFEKGKTVGLCLHLTKSLYGTGSVVVMDSAFCVVKAITELRMAGVFSSALIKKRRYWPHYVNGDGIKAHFNGKKPGDFDALKGTLDNVDYYIYGKKEPDYVLLFMTTYGCENRMGLDQSQIFDDGGVKGKIKFKYPEVCHNHYQHRDSVDNHNGHRMFPIVIEEQWKTTRWPNREFQFLLAVTEVSCNLINNYCFDDMLYEQIDFWYELGAEKINNPYIIVGESPNTRKKRNEVIPNHELISLPPFMTFRGREI
jgi:hypothetical protein